MQAVGAAWLMVQLEAPPAVVAGETATYCRGESGCGRRRRRPVRLPPLMLVTQTIMLGAAGTLAALSASPVTPQSLLRSLRARVGARSTHRWQATSRSSCLRELKQAVTLGGANSTSSGHGPPSASDLAVAVQALFALNEASFASCLRLWRWNGPRRGIGPPEASPWRAPASATPLPRASSTACWCLVRVRPGQRWLMSAEALYRARPRLGLRRVGILTPASGSAPCRGRVVCRACGSGSARPCFASASGSSRSLSSCSQRGSSAGRGVSVVAASAGSSALHAHVASQELLPSGCCRGLALYLTAFSAASPWQRAWVRCPLAVCVDVGRRIGGAGRPWRSPTLAVRRIAEWTSPAPMSEPEACLIGAEDSTACARGRPPRVPRTPNDFLRALRPVGRPRRVRRDHCRVRDAERDHRYVETFVLPSGTTLRRQAGGRSRHQRWRRSAVPSGALIRRRSTSSRRRSASATAPR